MIKYELDLNEKTKMVSTNLEYHKKLKSIVCRNTQYYSGPNKTLVLEYAKNAKADDLFTYTLRHFKEYPKRFQNVKEFCAAS